MTRPDGATPSRKVEPKPTLPVGQLAAGATKLEWFQSPVLFFPARVAAGQASVIENDGLIEAPLAWAVSARIGAAVVIDMGTRQIPLAAGDIVPQVVLRSGSGLDTRYAFFCTRNKITQKKVASGILDRLEFGLVDSLRDAQWCLQDIDGDGSFDTAFGLNDGSQFSQAGPIEPIPYEILVGETIPGEGDRLTVTMVRVGKKDVTLALNITQMGKAMKFDRLESGSYRAGAFTLVRYGESGPGTAMLLGLRFEVLSADRKANQASLQWRPAMLRPDEFIVIPRELHAY